jgi:hypothetical protein
MNVPSQMDESLECLDTLLGFEHTSRNRSQLVQNT